MFRCTFGFAPEDDGAAEGQPGPAAVVALGQLGEPGAYLADRAPQRGRERVRVARVVRGESVRPEIDAALVVAEDRVP